MAASADIIIGDTPVTVRELTVAEVRDWAREIECGGREIDPAGDALFDDVTAADIRLMSNATSDVLDGLPSEIRPLADLCKKVNPHFFRLRAVYQAAHLAQIRSILSGQSAKTSS